MKSIEEISEQLANGMLNRMLSISMQKLFELDDTLFNDEQEDLNSSYELFEDIYFKLLDNPKFFKKTFEELYGKFNDYYDDDFKKQVFALVNDSPEIFENIKKIKDYFNENY